MSKKIAKRFIGVAASFLVILFIASAATAGDRLELENLKPEELTAKISEFQRKLDQNPSDYESIKGLGVAYYIRAREDAKKFAAKSVEMLTRACKMNKKDYEALSYLGSSTTMMAKTTWNPMKKSSYANKGIAMMDKAVKRDPDNVTVRLTRAHNSRRLPYFFEREGVAIEDFEYITEMIKKDPKAYGHLKRHIYSNLVELYKKNDQEAEAEKYKKMLEEH